MSARFRLDLEFARPHHEYVLGEGLLAELGPRTARFVTSPQCVLVTDANVAATAHAAAAEASMRKAGLVPHRTVVAAGESSKSVETAAALWSAFAEAGLAADGAVVALGGGVVGDLAGFCAATWMRGVALVHAPTTVVAMADSAVGGKTAIDLPAGKNLVGAFHSPALVICDPLVLDTLSRREFRAGLYEVVKYGVIASGRLFNRVHRDLAAIFERDPAVLTPIVAACCRIKAEVVMADERETGPRRALNFGHTVGHALEAITRYRRFRHGEAIGYGMLAAARLSVLRGTMTQADEMRLAAVLRDMGARPPIGDLRVSDALDVIARDKKVVAGRLHFVLASGIGRTTVVSDVHTRELVLVMRAIGMTP